MAELSLPKKIVFALLPTLALLALAEGVLRWKGSAERCPGYEGSYLWACDPILHYRNGPGAVIGGRPLNAAGFRGPDFGPPQAGVTQVLALGDSSTYGVIARDDHNTLEILVQPYPTRLQALADERLGPGRVEVWNAAVPGYNSWHGVMLLRSKLRDLRPDVITVRFGWNDLAMGGGHDSADAFAESDSALLRGLEDLLLRTKLYAFARRLGLEWQSRRQAGAPPALPSVWQPTIPPARFARNLRRIVELGRGRGAEVWLLTTPDPFHTPDDLRFYAARPATSSAKLTLAVNAVPSFERLAEIHEEYNQVVRQVAAETGAPLLDLAAAYRRHPSQELYTPGDVIHPNEAGHQLEAEMLFERLAPLVQRQREP